MISMKRFGKEGISEIVGTVLLLAIAVIAFSVLAIYVFSSTTPSTSTPHVNLVGYINNEGNITIQHQGGEHLDLDDVKIIVWKGEVDSCSYYFQNGHIMGEHAHFNDSNANKKWDVGEYIEINVTAIFGNITNWQISVVVIDEESNSIIMSGVLQEGITRTVSPVALFDYEPWNPKFLNSTGLSDIIVFNASQSYDPDGGRIQTYKWDFESDGAIDAYGIVVFHRYPSVGIYNVTLVVIDDEGQTDSATTGVDVNVPPPVNVTYNIPPQGTFEWEVDPNIDGTINFYSNVTDPDGTIVSYYWSFGDGTYSSSPNPSHTYQYSGEYTVQLIVTDDSGEQTIISQNITVPNILPIAGFSYSPRNITTVLTVTFDGGEPYSYDKDGYIVSWEWDFGDGGTATGEIVTHKFTNPGNYTVTLTVTDNSGGESNISKVIRVYPKPAASPPTYLIVDNTPIEWDGISNILGACIDLFGSDNWQDYICVAKAIDDWYFYSGDKSYVVETTEGTIVVETTPSLRGQRIDDTLINQFDIVIWSCGNFPGDGGYANYEPWLSHPNYWSTAMTEGEYWNSSSGGDDNANHVYELAQHLTGNVTAGTLLLSGTYVVRDLQNYPGNGAASSEIWLGNVLGVREPVGGIDYDPSYEPFSGRLGTTYFRGKPYYAAGILYGVLNTSSGQLERSYLRITSPIKLYALHKNDTNPIFKYSLYSNGTEYSTILSEDFEGDNPPSGWTHGGARDEWEWGTPIVGPSPHSGSKLYGTDLDGYYNNNANCWLMTPAINLTNFADAQLEFWHWYRLEYRYDYVYVEVSDDGGSTWHTLASYTGNSNWRKKTIDLSAYVGKTIYIRWRLRSDWSVVRYGYYLDDVTIRGAISAIPEGYYAIDAERGRNRSIVLGFDLNADEIDHESRTLYMRNVLAWLAEGAGYVTEVWVDCNGTEEWLNQPNHFATIQEGINAVSPGGVVYVIGNNSQTYYEDVLLNKSVDLIAVGNPKIVGNNYGIKVVVDWATIDGFTIEDSTYGIYLENVARTTVRNCTIENTGRGIYLYFSHNNTIQNCTITNNIYGVYISKGLGNKIINNEITLNSENGLYLYYASLNQIRNNTISDSNIAIYIDSSEKNKVENNTILNSTEEAVYMVYSTNMNTVANNTILNNLRGIRLVISNTNSIINNEIANNTLEGIILEEYSHSNTIRENEIYNVSIGVSMENSSSNYIILNEIYNTTIAIKGYYSASNIIQNNEITTNEKGLSLEESSDDNVIVSNNITNNSIAIYIYNSGSNNITENTITYNEEGILLDLALPSINGRNNIANNTILYNNGTAIYLYNSMGNYIVYNYICSNNGDGIKLEYLSHSNQLIGNTITNNSYGIHLRKGSYNTISSNNISANRQDGILIAAYSTENLLQNNTISFNQNGIKLDSTSTNYVYNNTIYSNEYGLVLRNSFTNGVENNTVYNNSNNGIMLTSSDVNRLVNNTIYSNEGNGIYLLLSGGSGNYILNNTIYENALHGIYLNTSRTATAGNNEITGNEIYNNGGNGIYLLSSDVNYMKGNILYNNSDGISLYSSDGNTLQLNIICQNTYSGINLSFSNSNSINNNTIYLNLNGIYLYQSSQGDDHKLESNSIYSNVNAGIYINSSDSNYFGFNGINIICNNTYGIYIVFSTSNFFAHNIICNNSYGIYMANSSTNNEVYENNITTNDYGVYVASSDCTTNWFYWNNFINNTLHNDSQAYDRGNNSWYKATTGNYWSDHISTDPYTIPPGINQDKYPLLSPREWWL